MEFTKDYDHSWKVGKPGVSWKTDFKLTYLVSHYQLIKKDIRHDMVIKLVTAKTNFQFVGPDPKVFNSRCGREQGYRLF